MLFKRKTSTTSYYKDRHLPLTDDILCKVQSLSQSTYTVEDTLFSVSRVYTYGGSKTTILGTAGKYANLEITIAVKGDFLNYFTAYLRHSVGAPSLLNGNDLYYQVIKNILLAIYDSDSEITLYEQTVRAKELEIFISGLPKND